MVPAHPLSRIVFGFLGCALAGGLLAGCGDDDGGDVAAFCDAVEALREDDPFAELEIASPQEMRAAFVELEAAVARIDETAPAEADAQARRYRASVDDLVDHLRGAGYDPTQLDTLAYGRATSEYEAAARSVANAADALCD